MKRILFLPLTLCVCIAISACGSTSVPDASSYASGIVTSSESYDFLWEDEESLTMSEPASKAQPSISSADVTSDESLDIVWEDESLPALEPSSQEQPAVSHAETSSAAVSSTALPSTSSIASTPVPDPPASSKVDVPPEEPKITTVYALNTNTKKFHYSSCHSAKRIKAKNYSTCTDRAWAIANGYIPCKNCNP